MPIYHLRPVVAALEDAAWQTSTHRTECWVNAANEEEARGLASGKFQDGEATLPGHAGRPSPWRNPDLVAVAEAAAPNGMRIPQNTVVAG